MQLAEIVKEKLQSYTNKYNIIRTISPFSMHITSEMIDGIPEGVYYMNE